MSRIITITYLVLGFIIGYSSNTFLSGSTALPASTAKSIKPVELQKTTEKEQQGFQQKIDSVAWENVALQKQVQQVKQSLGKTKRTNAKLERQVTELIVSGYGITDTSEMVANCDTLEYAVQELLTSGSEKDSLYEAALSGLEKQVEGQDTALLLQQEQYQALRVSFDSSIAQQQSLVAENSSYKKALRRNKVKGRLLSMGALILGGLATYSLLH